MKADLSKLIKFHTELNPRLWQNNNLRREVEYKLLQIAKEFVKFINIDNLQLEDITISGSNCSYNYNDQSDIDLHLVVSSDNPCWPHLNELYMAKKTLFNDQHDIKIRDIDVEVYVQDSKQPHISNGIFSVLRDKWIKQPKMITADVDETNAEHKYKSLRFQIQIAVASEETDKIQAMMDKVKSIRKSGLSKNGEFGPENLAFKMLRNDGTLDELYAAAAEAQDKRLSLPEVDISEKINPEITQKDFHATKDIHIDGVGKLTLTVKNLSTSRPPEFLVNVTNEAGKDIGYFRFIVKDYDPDKRNIFGFRVKSKLDPHVIGGNISVWSEFQKKGIATAVYQFVKELGNDIKPSTTQTDAGKSMWRSFNRQSEVAESQALNELNIVQTLKFIQKAHGDQLYGELPYWHHPRAVAMTGKRIFGTSFSSDAAKVAFLHDVVEDTHVSLADLGSLDFSPEVVEAVGLLTKNKSLTYAQNIEQIINSGNRLAMMVKYADNYENYSGDKSSWDPNRAASMEKRYRKSMNMLAAKLGVNAHVDENFADGKGPGRPGDSQRHGIPKGATMAELEKASHAKGRKGQLARWQMNMRRGHKKESVEEEYGSAMTPQALRTRMNKLMNDDQKYTDPTQRTNWQDGVWRFINSNQAAIFADKGDKGNGDYPAAPYAAWLLVQHMDAHPERQSQFYMKLSKAFPNHPKLQFLKDRSAVNAWILKNATNPEYYVNGKPLPNPTVNVRNPAMFKDAAVKAKSREEALKNAEQAGNKLLVAAVKATNAQTQPSYTQQSESVNETRDAAFAWIKSKLPKWPEYVLRDWIYNSVRGDFGPESVHTEQHLRTVLAGEGMDADTQWQLVPNFKFSFQTLNPWTVEKIKARWGGESDMGMGIPKDAERHATQAALAQQQGGVRKEPVILKKIGNQYELIEGWHRTIQHFKQFPNGYTGPAWVATNARPVSEAGGPDMSRRGFLGGLGALVASSGLPKVAAGALQQILGITTPEHLENMQYALKSRGTLLQLTNDELDKISSAIKGAPLDTWPGFRGTHKSVYGNPLIDQAYRKLTGEDMKAARVARILKDNSIDPVKFFESPSVKAVIGKVRQEIAAKWAQSGASDEPFKSPGEPPKMDDKKARELEKNRDKAWKELKNRNSDRSMKGTAVGRMGPITAPLKPTHISPSGVATNMSPDDDDYQINYGAKGAAKKPTGKFVKPLTHKVNESVDDKPLIREPFKDPVAVLRKYLDKMSKPDWDKIDLLMKKIANRNGIGADLLHKMWVDKYKKTPDAYCGIENKAKKR